MTWWEFKRRQFRLVWRLLGAFARGDDAAMRQVEHDTNALWRDWDERSRS